MATLVVNVRTDEYDVYIGRAGRGCEGTFGNPFVPRERTPGGVAECLRRFRDYFLGRYQVDEEFARQVRTLRGKRLGCFCAGRGGLTCDDRPHVCHGQVIAEFLDRDLYPAEVAP